MTIFKFITLMIVLSGASCNIKNRDKTPQESQTSIVDTFRIIDQVFKARVNQTNCDLFRFVNDTWAPEMKIMVYEDFSVTDDCNHDGYIDIYSQSQGWSYINYYLPEQKSFSKQYKLPGDDELVIDSSKNLYANFREPYHQCNFFESQLFDYKGSTPHVYYLLSGETSCQPDSIKILKLFKYDKLNDTLLLIRTMAPRNPNKFEYETFWKMNYKDLLGYR